MAYVAGTWNTPINIVGTMQIQATDEAIEAILNTDANSMRNFINSEFQNIETELGSYTSAVQTLTNKTLNDYTNFIHADAAHLRIKATVAISKGQPFIVTGWNVGESALEVILGDNAVGPSNGVAEQTLAIGEFGMGIIGGVLTDVDTSAWAEKAILFVNGAGQFTTVEPETGYAQPLAYVLRSNAINGALQITADYPKQDADDVRFTSQEGLTAIRVRAAIDEIFSSLTTIEEW